MSFFLLLSCNIFDGFSEARVAERDTQAVARRGAIRSLIGKLIVQYGMCVMQDD